MKIEYNNFDKNELEVAESVLFNGNGFIGLRNNLFEEYYDGFSTNRETYINGFYEEKEYNYPEVCYGFTPKGESMVSVVDFQTLHVYINEIKLNTSNFTYSNHNRGIDIVTGVSYRSFIATDKSGNQTKIFHNRIVSFVDRSLVIEQYKFIKLNHSLTIDLVNDINFNAVKTIDYSDPRVSHQNMNINIDEINTKMQFIKFSTSTSKLNAFAYYDYNQNIDKYENDEKMLRVYFKDVANEFIKAVKYSYNSVENVSVDYEKYAILQSSFLDNFWQNAKIEIETTDKLLEQSVNYGIFALLQSVSTNSNTSISAKGLSGNGYEGHYFWDSEMYILPLFILLKPDIARSMLMYRIKKLDKAIKNREMIGYKSGALYPWRTISGDECSAFFEAGMAQHHINADICYGLIKYIEITNDHTILTEGGFDLLYQTSKFYESIIYKRDNKYHIDKITGPDEYKVLVNDNFYTNSLVVFQLKHLLKYDNNQLNNKEITLYQDIIENMYYGYNSKLNIIEQDRDFLNKQRWPYNESKHPLLMHYHPLEIYRYQVCKQADAVLACMLLDDEIDNTVIKNTVEYYDEVTTHDSSLSYSAFATVFAKIGDLEKSYEYFLKNANIDLQNTHGNTKDGIHTASIGGTFITLVYGFLNIKFVDNQIILNPNLPSSISKITLNISYCNENYKIIATSKNYSVEKKISD